MIFSLVLLRTQTLQKQCVDWQKVEKLCTQTLFYEDARALLKELAYFDEVTFENIDIEDPQWGGYKREYYVYVDDEYNVGVEPAWREKEGTDKGIYLGASGCIVLIHSDANSKIIEAMKDSDCAEFDIDIDADCDGSCECCEMFDDDDDDEDFDDDYEDFIGNVIDNFAEILASAIFIGSLTE